MNLGDNLYKWTRREGKLEASLEKVLVRKKIEAFLDEVPAPKPTTCVWIGPTYHLEGATYRKANRVVDEFYLLLEASIHGKCRLIDSRPLVVSKTPNDGLHHIASDSLAWGEAVLGKLK